MSNGHGGSRVGAGRKKTAIVERIADDTYKKKIEVLKVDNELFGNDMPEPSQYLSQQTKGASENIGKAVYEKTWRWLQDRGCDQLVNPQIVEQYAMCIARWIQAENAVHTFGFLAKHPTTEMPIASPYIKISQDFLKQSTNLWLQIYQVVKENCTEPYGKDETDPMAILLNQQPHGGFKV